MPLRGELDSVDLAHVFQMLVLNQKAGTLEIVHEGAKRRLYFGAEAVWIPTDPERLSARAAGALLREGRVSADQLERARYNAKAARKSAIDTLVDMAVLSSDDRDRLLRAQLEEQVYELFFLRGAHFEFRDDEAPQEGDLDPRLGLNANGLIMEAARRVDEWQYIQDLVHSGSDIFVACGDLSAFEERDRVPELKAVHGALDGVTTVDGVIEKTGIGRFLVFRHVALLVERGAAIEVPADSLVEQGNRLLEEGDRRAALDCLERAIQLGCEDVAVLTAAGTCLEELGATARAAKRYLEGGRVAEDRGELEDAIHLYLRVRAMLPTEIEAREHLFGLRQIVGHHPEGGGYDAEREGSDLARILHEIGRRDAVRQVLTGLLDSAAGDSAALERVSDLAAALGQPSFSTEARLLAAEAQRAKGDFAGALRLLKAARQLDPTREDLATLARVLQNSMASKRDRKRTSVRVVAMIVGSALFVLGYGRYSKAALDAFGLYSVEDFLISKDFAGGREHYESIRRRYPLTVPFLLAAEKLREMEIHEKHFAEVEEYRKQVQGEQQATNLKQARGLKEAALDARHSGDFRKALELLRRALAYCGGADPLDIVRDVDDLETYLADAARLRAEAAFFRNAGRFGEAHQRLRELASEYPQAPDATSLVLPVSIESTPPGARIRIDGEPVRIGDGRFTVEAETPFVVDLPAGRPVQVALLLDGFAPYSTRFAAVDAAALQVALPKRPHLEAILPRPATQPLAVDDHDVVVALQSGRISALDPGTLEVRWTRELPDLAEASAAPVLTPDAVLVSANNGKLVVLERADGALRLARDLPGKPVSAPAVSGSLVAVRCERGTLALGPLDGDSPLAVEEMRSPVVLGPVALPAERFAIACADGKAWVRSRDGTLSLLRRGPSGGGVTALVASGATLWVGDDLGWLHGFDATTQEPRCAVEALPGQPIVAISPDAVLPAVASEDVLAVVDCVKGETVATLRERGRLAGGSQAYVAAVFEDGTLRIHARENLELLSSFATDEPIAGEGALHDSDGWFAGAAGRVIGIRVAAR